MNYTKPEIVLSGSALNTIQMGAKGNFLIPDSTVDPITHTNAAYEADE
jgi:hypothetical protein